MMLLAALPAIALSLLWRGYVLSVMWAWFAVTALSAPPLDTLQAAGLALIVTLLTYHRQPAKPKSSWEDFAESLLIGLLAPALMLLIGWIVKSFQ